MAHAMVGKDRDDDTGQYTDTYPTDEFIEAIRELGGAAGTREIAEAVDCHRDTARRRLNSLTDEGLLMRKDVGDAALWIIANDEEE